MDDAAHVGHAEGTGDIEPDARRLPRRQPAAASQPHGQILPVDQGHHEVGPVPVGAGVEAGDDVGVAENGCGERLASEALGKVRVRGDLGAQDLDGDLALETKVGGPVDRRHPAPADDRPEPIATTQQVLGGVLGGAVPRIGHARTIVQVRRMPRPAYPCRFRLRWRHERE